MTTSTLPHLFQQLPNAMVGRLPPAQTAGCGLVPLTFRSLSSNVCYEGDKEWQRDTQTRLKVMRCAWRQPLPGRRLQSNLPRGDSNHTFNIAPNLLDQDFSADGPNQKWAGDISDIWTSEGWLYLAVIFDLYSRRVIGWAVSNRMKRDLAIRALDMAVALRQPPKDCIHHTDRGSQYCSGEYHEACPSMGSRSQ